MIVFSEVMGRLITSGLSKMEALDLMIALVSDYINYAQDIDVSDRYKMN